MSYINKYLKYKLKYINLQKQIGSGRIEYYKPLNLRIGTVFNFNKKIYSIISMFDGSTDKEDPKKIVIRCETKEGDYRILFVDDLVERGPVRKHLFQIINDIPNKSVLIIGGGNPLLYGSDYYEVGGHPTSDFGKDKDWREKIFWDELETSMGDKKFKAIYFDEGSESWLQDIKEPILIQICNLFRKILEKEGVIIIASWTKLKNILYKILLEDNCFLSSFRIGKGMSEKYNIFSFLPLHQTLLKDKTHIYEGNDDILGVDMGGWTKWDPKMSEVVEQNIVDFIRKRIIL